VTTLIAFLFVLGVLIFVHELGHFLAARRIGVRVLTFSLGFGPKLIAVKRGDTEYCVSAMPLGGYVKMAARIPTIRVRSARRVPLEDQVGAVPGPHHGTGDEHPAGFVLLASCWPGRGDGRVQGPAAGHRRGDAWFACRQVGIKPGDRILTVAGRTSERGTTSKWRSAIRRVNRDVE
jgi:membrane-associated protease RseP (regulator of RpoE activity)